MPAVVVDDITVLPRIPEPDPAIARPRPVRSVTSAPRGFEGEGFPVRRAFAGVDLGDLDPFVHLDQMGEVEYAPGEPKGTPWHPHRGFETVTYMIDGIFEHADSNGGGGLITNGDTQWMTAGAGILHIEKPPEALVVSGGLFHGLQLWVNLPRDLRCAKSGRRRVIRIFAQRKSRSSHRATGVHSSGSSPGTSPAIPGRARRTRR
jgi:redox-sensitive bicupin YhaK (pirin superfamily)